MSDTLYLKPHQYPDGRLPVVDANIIFVLWDGETCTEVFLPAIGKRISIINRGSAPVKMGDLLITQGRGLRFDYHPATARWSVVLPAEEWCIFEDGYPIVKIPVLKNTDVFIPSVNSRRVILEDPSDNYPDGMNIYCYTSANNATTDWAKCRFEHGRLVIAKMDGSRENPFSPDVTSVAAGQYVISADDGLLFPRVDLVAGTLFQAQTSTAKKIPASGCSNNAWTNMDTGPITGDYVILTPASSGSHIPSSDKNIYFIIDDDDTSQRVTLPSTGTKITLLNNSRGVMLSYDSLFVMPGQIQTFVFHPAKNMWSTVIKVSKYCEFRLNDCYMSIPSIGGSVGPVAAFIEADLPWDTTLDLPTYYGDNTDLYLYGTSVLWGYHFNCNGYARGEVTHFRYHSNHSWDTLESDGSLSAPYDYRTPPKKDFYYLALPIDDVRKPTISRIEVGTLYRAVLDDGTANDPGKYDDEIRWINMDDLPNEVAGLQNVRIYSPQGNCIFSNGNNSIAINITFTAVNKAGKTIKRQNIARMPTVRLISYEDGSELGSPNYMSTGWVQSTEPYSYVPFTVMSESPSLTPAESDVDDVCKVTLYIMHGFYPGAPDKILPGCVFTLADSREIVYSRGSGNTVVEPPQMIHSIPPRAFTPAEMQTSTVTLVNSKENPDYSNVYNSLLTHTWTAPSVVPSLPTLLTPAEEWVYNNLLFARPYYRTCYKKDSDHKKNWWFCTGGVFWNAGTWGDTFENNVGNLYPQMENFSIHLNVPENSIVITTYEGKGYCIPYFDDVQFTNGFDVYLRDQFGTHYCINVSSCNDSNMSPLLTCRVVHEED